MPDKDARPRSSAKNAIKPSSCFCASYFYQQQQLLAHTELPPSISSTILVQDNKQPHDKTEPGHHNCCSSWQKLKNLLPSHPIYICLVSFNSCLNSNIPHCNPHPTENSSQVDSSQLYSKSLLKDMSGNVYSNAVHIFPSVFFAILHTSLALTLI